MATNVNVLAFLFALRREHGNVFAALHAAPVFPGVLPPVHVEARPFGPLTETAATEYLAQLKEAFPEHY